MKTNNRSIHVSLLLIIGVVATLMAQEETQKLKERYNTSDNVSVLIDSQNTDLIFEDWNKDEVEVEAILETDGLTPELKQQLMDFWKVNVQGNSGRITITSSGGNLDPALAMGNLQTGNLNTLISSSMAMVQPLMQNMIAPMLAGLAGNQLPPEYYENLNNIKFDYNAYRKDGDKYLKAYQKMVETSFGDDFDAVMKKWEKENEDRMGHSKSEFLNGLKNIPQSPFGKQLNFDTSAYKKDKKGYVAQLNNRLGTKASVKDVDQWLLKMDQWSEKFSKDMENWGEDFGQTFAKNMEAWGKNYGNAMENNMAALGQDFNINMEALGKQFAAQAQQFATLQNGSFNNTVTRDANGNIIGAQISYTGSLPSPKPAITGKVKRKIIVHMPKAAKLDLNVRHGNIKINEASDARINLSHGGFIAQTIEGSKTYLTIAYSPIEIDSWNYGTLRTSYVKNCVINRAAHLNLDSRASNIVINDIDDTAVISGSFGEITIPSIGRNFHTINISLENSDLVMRLPETAYNFSYNGVQSSLNFPKKLDAKVMHGFGSEMVNGFYKSKNSDKSIVISSKFSDAVIN